MDGWIDGWMDGLMDGWMDGWMVGWMDGWMDGLQFLGGGGRRQKVLSHAGNFSDTDRHGCRDRAIPTESTTTLVLETCDPNKGWG